MAGSEPDVTFVQTFVRRGNVLVSEGVRQANVMLLAPGPRAYGRYPNEGDRYFDEEIAMTEHSQEQIDEEQEDLDQTRRQVAQGSQPGGRATRGPALDPPSEGTEIEPVPPYDRETSTELQDALAEGTRGTMHAGDQPSEPGQQPPVSKEEREGVPPTDTTAATPLGVGTSTTERGEELSGKEGKEEGRVDTEPKGPTQRPTGTSTGSDVTGVNPSKNPMHESDV